MECGRGGDGVAGLHGSAGAGTDGCEEGHDSVFKSWMSRSVLENMKSGNGVSPAIFDRSVVIYI